MAKRIKETVFNERDRNIPTFLLPPKTVHQQKAASGSKAQEERRKRFPVKEDPIITAKRRKETVFDRDMAILLVPLNSQHSTPIMSNRRKETIFNERDRNITKFLGKPNTFHQQKAASGSKTKEEMPKRFTIKEEPSKRKKETVLNEKEKIMSKLSVRPITLNQQEAASGSKSQKDRPKRLSIKEEPRIAKKWEEIEYNDRDRKMPKCRVSLNALNQQEAASGSKSQKDRPKRLSIKEEPTIAKTRKEIVYIERDRNMPKCGVSLNALNQQEAASGSKSQKDRPKRLSIKEEPTIAKTRKEIVYNERDRNMPKCGVSLNTLHPQEAATGSKTKKETPKRIPIKEELVTAKRRKETVYNERDRNMPKFGLPSNTVHQQEAASGSKTREDRQKRLSMKEEPIIAKRRKETVFNEKDRNIPKFGLPSNTVHQQEAASGSKTREDRQKRLSTKEEPIKANRRKETVFNEKNRNIPKFELPPNTLHQQEASSESKTREERPKHFPIKEEPIISKRRKETIINERDNDMRKLLVIPIPLHEQEAASKTKKKRPIRLSTKEEPVIVQMQEEPPVDLSDIEEQPEAGNHKVISRVMEIFPDAHPNFVKKLCRNKEFADVDDIVTEVLSNESYPRRQQLRTPRHLEYNIEEQLEIVQALLPDADPTYLRYQCEKFGRDTEQLTLFVNEASENKDYPTMKEHLRKQKLSAQCKQYTKNFDVEKYVDLFPDPEKTFRDQNRQFIIHDETSYDGHIYLRNFFRNKYDNLAISNITSILMKKKNNILSSDDEMKDYIKRKVVLKCRRKPIILEEPPKNIAILQELAYLTHKEEIENCMKRRKQEEENERKMAKEKNLLNTCQCCFDDEVVPKDTFCCPVGCSFCRTCIQTSCEVAMGDGKTNFNCLNNCSDEFSLATLQMVLPPKLFSNLAKKKALAEVKAADIEELECCPFCDFATIPYPNDKVFRCLDPDCMKESCRLCKEENHIPYKCDEIEQADDVKARVFVENKMTEALLRKCWNCKKSFFKEEGCNKMTCSCGAQMCYMCNQPLKEKPYAHFNGLGGTNYELCPLYTDTNDFNQKNVIKAAELAKTKIDPSKLKIDPTLDVKEYYEKRKEKLPQEPHIRILEDMRQAQGAQAAP